MTAKMKSKPHRKDSRADWERVRVKIMRWCLRVKLAQNWRKFSELLLETGDRPIVEQSRKDDFWGAKPIDDNTLVGMNVLGRLLMELREAVKTESRETLCSVQPLSIPEFLLGGEPIGVVTTRISEISPEQTLAEMQASRGGVGGLTVVQQSLFDEQAMKVSPPTANPSGKERGVRIADLKPYATYKESGLPWLGRVPGHWEVLAIRRLFRAVTHKDVRGDEVKMSMSRHLGLVPSARLGARSGAKSDSITYSVCHVGELVMNKYQAQAGLFGCAIHRGLITSNYTVFKPSPDANAAFFAKLFSSKPYQTAFEVESHGVGDGMSPLYTGVFYRIFTVLPPLAEQVAIVRFLDWANGRLERAIRAKRDVIELLNEQKQAVIHRVVTRGLDPSVSLKRSGIPWLGDVPQHWDVVRVCRLFRQVSRYTAQGDEPKLSMSRRYGLIRSDQLANRAAQAATSIKFSICEPGDLILNKYQAHNGLFGAATERGLITSNYSVFEPAKSACTEFYALLFASPLYCAEFRMRCQGVGDGMMPLYSGAFLKTPTLAPPEAEQRSIVDFITNSTKEVAQAISRLEREIELLHEYRNRLVAEVVTGQLDVREAAKRLPDEVPLDIAEEDAEPGGDEAEAADEVVAL